MEVLPEAQAFSFGLTAELLLAAATGAVVACGLATAGAGVALAAGALVWWLAAALLVAADECEERAADEPPRVPREPAECLVAIGASSGTESNDGGGMKGFESGEAARRDVS